MIIGVDVDLTVVDSLNPWITWYRDLTGHDITEEISSVNNDLQDLMKRHSDPLAFWKKPDLYDKLEPFEEAITVLRNLHEQGHTIIFVSTCFPEHENSKRMFIQRNFPFSSGFISTGDKQFVKMDVFIDDYKKNLVQVKTIQPDCFCYHFDSGINTKGRYEYGDWDRFQELVNRLEN